MLTLGLILTLFAPPTETWEPARMLAQCWQLYDISCVQSLLDQISPSLQDTDTRVLRAQAHLLLAELHRIEYEAARPDLSRERRELGRQIDEAAQQGLENLDGVFESSEVLSLKADLLGTMIRTPYDAAKHRKRMIRLAEKAMELNPKNVNAWLSLAKPFLFAPAGQGQDLTRAGQAIKRALEINPELEKARVLQALLLEKAGDFAAARSEWQALLEQNPQCLPAKRALEHLLPSTR